MPHSRRSFIQGVTAAAFAAAALPAHAQTAPATTAAPKRKPIPKAVNLGMCKDGATVLEKFQIIKECGFDGVEINRPDAIPMEELIAARNATGLPVLGVICTTHWGKPLNHNDPKIREQGARGLELALKESGELGCANVLLVPGVVNEAHSYADCWKRSIEAIRAAVPVAKAAKARIAIENVWNHFIIDPLSALRYLEEINEPEWVGWHFDIGNCVTFGWPEQWITALGARVFNLHFKEYSRKERDKSGPFAGFRAELGEGDVKWTRVMEAVDSIPFKGAGILEVGGGNRERLKFLAERTNQLIAS
jgi:hexulose-6-phosphate isomerase